MDSLECCGSSAEVYQRGASALQLDCHILNIKEATCLLLPLLLHQASITPEGFTNMLNVIDSSHSWCVQCHPMGLCQFQSPVQKAFLAAFFNVCEHHHLSWPLPHDGCESWWIRWGLCTDICRQTNHQASFWSRVKDWHSRTDAFWEVSLKSSFQ